MSENDLKNELASVESEISQIDRAIQKLLAKQQKLQDKRDELQLKLQESSSAKLASLDWESSDRPWSDKLVQTLKKVFKIEKFRPYQLSTMNAVLSKHDCILIMPTGGGKSLCFQLPALIFDGIALVISPLVSLMEDQIMALQALNYPVSMLSANATREKVNEVHKAMTEKGSKLKLLYVTPEKLAKSKRFLAKLEKMYTMGRFSLLAIDEVHCCSQWGHDFRKDYKFLGIMKRQFPEVPILGLTATATSRVVSDVQNILNIQGCLVLKASFNRPNLKYEVCYKSSSQNENVSDIEKLLKGRFHGKSGIIYCFSIKDSEDIAAELRKRGIRAKSYHAQLDALRRSAVHKSWAANEIQVVVATVAFGMGIDKPDVRFVIHHSIPKSMENFYQESGRAGRDDKPADCILFYRLADLFRQSTMVITEQTGLENVYAMIAYCLDLSRCRRSVIAQHFGERWESTDCKKMCDHCLHDNKSYVEEKDIIKPCLLLYKIIEHCASIDERLTAQKLIDIWLGKGSPKQRPPGHVATSLSRELCERVVAFLIIESYLKEDFHFTPYSTISYINTGPKAAFVKKGDRKILLEMLSTKKRSASDVADAVSGSSQNSQVHKKMKSDSTNSSSVSSRKEESSASKANTVIKHKKIPSTCNVLNGDKKTAENTRKLTPDGLDSSDSESTHELKRKSAPLITVSDSD